jgi:hypothetical protein
VDLFIENVLATRRPTQVADVIVRLIAIRVSHLMIGCWRLPEECTSNEPVHGQSQALAVSKEADTKIARVLQVEPPDVWPSALSASDSRNPTVAADGVLRGFFDRLPNFNVHANLFAGKAAFLQEQNVIRGGDMSKLIAKPKSVIVWLYNHLDAGTLFNLRHSFV